MSEVRQKCSEVYPSSPGTPYYNQCWGFRELPSGINFEVTGIRETILGSKCAEIYGGTSFTGMMTRMGPCSFDYQWSNGRFGILLSMNENKPPLSSKIDQGNADLMKWRIGGSMSEKTKTAFCVMTDPPMGKVHLEITGTISNDVCEADFRIWVHE